MVFGVVLAAGAATRFGSPKQLLLLPYVLRALARVPLAGIIVVQGAYPLAESERLVLAGVTVVDCPEWQLGPGASLRCGLAALPEEAQAAIVVLADGPFLDPRTIERVLSHRGEADVLVASYNGTRGHPALLERAAFAGVPDAGARELEALLVPCDDLTEPGDIDTPDLAEGL